MEALDWLVIGVFFLALIGIIVWVVRQKQNDSADYFLGGRDATWLAIGASIFASNIGSEHLIGLAGAGASFTVMDGSFSHFSSINASISAALVFRAWAATSAA